MTKQAVDMVLLMGGVPVLENMHKIRPKRPEIDTEIDYLHLREYLKS